MVQSECVVMGTATTPLGVAVDKCELVTLELQCRVEERESMEVVEGRKQVAVSVESFDTVDSTVQHPPLLNSDPAASLQAAAAAGNLSSLESSPDQAKVEMKVHLTQLPPSNVAILVLKMVSYRNLCCLYKPINKI